MRKLLFLMISVLGISVGEAGGEDAGSVAKFHNAVQAGDVKAARTILASNPSPETSADEHEFQPIHLILSQTLMNFVTHTARGDPSPFH